MSARMAHRAARRAVIPALRRTAATATRRCYATATPKGTAPKGTGAAAAAAARSPAQELAWQWGSASSLTSMSGLFIYLAYMWGPGGDWDNDIIRQPERLFESFKRLEYSLDVLLAGKDKVPGDADAAVYPEEDSLEQRLATVRAIKYVAGLKTSDRLSEEEKRASGEAKRLKLLLDHSAINTASSAGAMCVGMYRIWGLPPVTFVAMGLLAVFPAMVLVGAACDTWNDMKVEKLEKDYGLRSISGHSDIPEPPTPWRPSSSQ